MDDIELTLTSEQSGSRLDIAIAALAPKLSRSFIAKLLKDGAILIDAHTAKPSYTVRGGEHVSIELPEPEVIEAKPENIPLDVVYEDSDIIVINKPAGMVTHPSSGHTTGALVNALMFRCTDLSSINGRLRPGIVHRLDKDTSGVIVAAKNDTAHRGLAEQFSGRTIKKEYVALAHGDPLTETFFNDGRIGRHVTRRTEMTVLRGESEGREAYTDFAVLERFKYGSPKFLVKAVPRTGRTHQIRVHLAKLGFPILADTLYGKEEEVPELGLHRHALHAQRITFVHPATKEKLSFEAKLPDDIEGAIEKLRNRK